MKEQLINFETAKLAKEKGLAHGHWVVNWKDGGGFDSYYVNGVELGFDYNDWSFGLFEKIYYAR